MAKTTKSMEKTTIIKLPVFYSEQFRTPLEAERKIGLWVDRIGQRTDKQPSTYSLRILGQFAAVFIEKGSGYLFSKSSGKIPVEKGDVMIVFPDEPHRYYPLKRWTEKWIVWNGPQANLIYKLGLLSKDKMVIRDYRSVVRDAHKRLSLLMDKEDISAIFERKLIILQMIQSLFQYNSKGRIATNYTKQFDDITKYITSNYNRDIHIDELAHKAHLSPSHFRRLFKSHTGRSPKQFITSIRISKAKQFLAEGYPIKQSADMVGYDDVFYFMKVFKKTVGISSGAFAKSFHS